MEYTRSAINRIRAFKAALLILGAAIDWTLAHRLDELQHELETQEETGTVPKIQTYFGQDNFTTRRTTGHNMLDPESFITGRELMDGFTYTNSHRHFATQALYDAVVSGEFSTNEIPLIAPRVFNNPYNGPDADNPEA